MNATEITTPSKLILPNFDAVADQPDPGFAERQELIALLIKFDAIGERTKKLYAQKDQIEAQILEKLAVGVTVDLPDGRKAEIVDNLAGLDKKTGKPKNKIWKIAGACRFEIEITPVKKPSCRKGKSK